MHRNLAVLTPHNDPWIPLLRLYSLPLDLSVLIHDFHSHSLYPTRERLPVYGLSFLRQAVCRGLFCRCIGWVVFRTHSFRPGSCLASLAWVLFIGSGLGAASLLAGVGWVACSRIFLAVLLGLARLGHFLARVLQLLLLCLPCLYLVLFLLIRLLPRTLRPPRILHELLPLFTPLHLLLIRFLLLPLRHLFPHFLGQITLLRPISLLCVPASLFGLPFLLRPLR